ncbi:hypothetical protein CDG77_01560 [Nostoc sp. 'Peltigera membranacea cyanobiont' 213]|nr:hypothetical protein CDG77_01560 [Nostoc sp. 'Peltigera membranacea cyanobiont' 213]
MSEKFFCIHLTLGDPPKSPDKLGDFKTLILPFLRGVGGDQQIFDTSQTSSKECGLNKVQK